MDLFSIVGIAGAIGAALILLVIGFIVFRAWYVVPKADEAIVIVGKRQTSADGEASKMSVITGGGAFVNKLMQRADKISLRSRQIKMEPTAQTINGVTIDLTAVALVKIGSAPEHVRRAAERFASQDGAIELFTTEQLEGALRGVVAKLTVEQVMQDRQKLSDEIAEGISADLLAQGLVLDSFAIQGITDQNQYISSLGAKEVQRVKREAEVAEIEADREVKKRQIATDEANLIEQTALDKNTAAAKAEVGRANAEAAQAEALAHAQAEQGVLQQNAENRQAQLDADVKRVADADKYKRTAEADADAYEAQKTADTDAYRQQKAAEAARQVAQERADGEAYALRAQADARQASAAAEAEAVRLQAEAEAAAIRATGTARADAIKAEAEALRENQDAVLAKEIVAQLPALLESFAKGYSNVGAVTLIGGDSAASHIAREQATSITATFESVKAATGLDLGAVLQGQSLGRGIATGTQAADSAHAGSTTAR